MNILPNIILFLIAKTCLHFQQWWMAAFAHCQDWSDGVRDNDGSKSRQLSPSMSNALASRVEVKLGRLTERTRVFACLSDLALKRVFMRTGVFFCFVLYIFFGFFAFFLLCGQIVKQTGQPRALANKGWQSCFRMWLRSMSGHARGSICFHFQHRIKIKWSQLGSAGLHL